MIYIGPIGDAIVIAIGGIIGTCLGKKIPKDKSDAILKGLALVTIAISIQSIMEGNNVLVTIVSIVFGTAIGEILDIENKIDDLGNRFNSKLVSNNATNIPEAFIIGTIFFSVGPMSVMAAIDATVMHDNSYFYFKILADLIAVLIYASAMGIGISFSSISVFLVELILVLLSQSFSSVIEASIDNICQVGGVMMLGLAFNMLGLTKLRVTNMIPSIILAIFIGRLFI